MSVRIIDVRGRKVAVAEAGDGPPIVYLHGFADVHGVAGDLRPFHQRLARHARRDRAGASRLRRLGRARRLAIDDVIFHYLELFDAARPPAVRPGRPLRRRLDRGRARGPPSRAGGAGWR